jgi:V8-like Glu-specific endopeptidase
MDLSLLSKASWPAVGLIKAYFPALQNTAPPFASGTATLISPWAVLTAGHVAYDPSPDRGGQANSFDIEFGNGAFVRGIPGSNARVMNAYKSSPTSLSPFDMSVVLLGTRVSTITPAAVVRRSVAADLAGFSVNVVGYPAVQADLFGKLYGAADIARVDPGLNNGFSIQYPISTLGGMSGGPVYRTDEAAGGLFIRAVHTDLLTNGDGNGLILYESLVAQISSWVGGG